MKLFRESSEDRKGTISIGSVMHLRYTHTHTHTEGEKCQEIYILKTYKEWGAYGMRVYYIVCYTKKRKETEHNSERNRCNKK